MVYVGVWFLKESLAISASLKPAACLNELFPPALKAGDRNQANMQAQSTACANTNGVGSFGVRAHLACTVDVLI